MTGSATGVKYQKLVEHVIEVCTKFTEARKRLKLAVEDLGINFSTPEILRSTAKCHVVG